MSIIRDALDQIRERAEKATEGPWEIEGSLIGGRRYAVGQAFGIKWRDDLPFIAHARTDVPRLVAAIEAVLKVHTPEEGLHEHLECTHIHCRDLFQDQMPWPCPTVRALTGKLTGEDDESD